MKNILIVLSLAVVSFGIFSCGQNAHVTGETPQVNLGLGYVGDDATNGNYEVNLGLNNDTKPGLNGDEYLVLTFDSPTGDILYFSGKFALNSDLKATSPIEINQSGIQNWEQIQSAIVSGNLAESGSIIFNKKLWALDSGRDTYYYRLFKDNGDFVPEASRHPARPLRMTVQIKNKYGVGSTEEIIMPVRYRYGFDDEALGNLSSDSSGYSFPRETVGPAANRQVAGLEWASGLDLLSQNLSPLCTTAYGINYNFYYVKTGAGYAATVNGLRNNGNWSAAYFYEPSVLKAIGAALGGVVAAFTPPSAYSGECTYKVMGIVLADRFMPIDVDGIRYSITNGTTSNEVIYGLTKMEAF